MALFPFTAGLVFAADEHAAKPSTEVKTDKPSKAQEAAAAKIKAAKDARSKAFEEDEKFQEAKMEAGPGCVTQKRAGS
ncbi:MAG: hypothetical protein ACLQPD_36665 [Desulfomonilaceae bacterium]